MLNDIIEYREWLDGIERSDSGVIGLVNTVKVMMNVTTINDWIDWNWVKGSFVFDGESESLRYRLTDVEGRYPVDPYDLSDRLFSNVHKSVCENLVRRSYLLGETRDILGRDMGDFSDSDVRRVYNSVWYGNERLEGDESVCFSNFVERDLVLVIRGRVNYYFGRFSKSPFGIYYGIYDALVLDVWEDLCSFRLK